LDKLAAQRAERQSREHHSSAHGVRARVKAIQQEQQQVDLGGDLSRSA